MNQDDELILLLICSSILCFIQPDNVTPEQIVHFINVAGGTITNVDIEVPLTRMCIAREMMQPIVFNSLANLSLAIDSPQDVNCMFQLISEATPNLVNLRVQLYNLTSQFINEVNPLLQLLPGLFYHTQRSLPRVKSVELVHFYNIGYWIRLHNHTVYSGFLFEELFRLANVFELNFADSIQITRP